MASAARAALRNSPFHRMLSAMRLPATQPVNDPVGLWSLQLELLAMAESQLGPRGFKKDLPAAVH